MRHLGQVFQSGTRFAAPLKSLSARTARVVGLLGLLLFVQTEVSAQNPITVYSSVNCHVSVKIIWSNTNCPGTAPFSTATCDDVYTAVSPVTIYPPTGFTKAAKVEFWCGDPNDCMTPSGPWFTWPSCGVGVPTQYLNCCGQSLDIQGSIEKRGFRIDQ